jgi:hypothetical protein
MMPQRVIGAESVVHTLGRWPDFHDAEILDVHIVRGGCSTITVMIMDPRVPQRKVTFLFEDIRYLELGGEDADGQNVISSIHVSGADDLTTVSFGPCYGLSGYVMARRVSASVEAE